MKKQINFNKMMMARDRYFKKKGFNFKSFIFGLIKEKGVYLGGIVILKKRVQFYNQPFFWRRSRKTGNTRKN